MSYGLAALVAWLATAGLGAALVLMWIARASRRRTAGASDSGRPPPYIPSWLVAAHVTMAVGGLVAWAAALAGSEPLALVAVGALFVVALLGVSMFLRWLGSRRARRVAQALSGAPAESRLPTLVVVGHGMMGILTVLLVLLSFDLFR